MSVGYARGPRATISVRSLSSAPEAAQSGLPIRTSGTGAPPRSSSIASMST